MNNEKNIDHRSGGFIGKRLVNRLALAQNFDVTACYRSMPDTEPHGVSCVELDLANKCETIRALHDCDFVVHLAGKNIRQGLSTSEHHRIVNSLTLFTKM